MKKIGSLCRRKPYVFSFYLKPLGRKVDPDLDFPCMTHAFYCESLSLVQTHLRKLLAEYRHLGIELEAFLEDGLDLVDVDSIIQHYDTQLFFDF